MDTPASRAVKSGKAGARSSIGEHPQIDGELRLTMFRLITLNALKASDEISEEQSRQVRPPIIYILGSPH